VRMGAAASVRDGGTATSQTAELACLYSLGRSTPLKLSVNSGDIRSARGSTLIGSYRKGSPIRPSSFGRILELLFPSVSSRLDDFTLPDSGYRTPQGVRLVEIILPGGIARAKKLWAVELPESYDEQGLTELYALFKCNLHEILFTDCMAGSICMPLLGVEPRVCVGADAVLQELHSLLTYAAEQDVQLDSVTVFASPENAQSLVALCKSGVLDGLSAASTPEHVARLEATLSENVDAIIRAAWTALIFILTQWELCRDRIEEEAVNVLFTSTVCLQGRGAIEAYIRAKSGHTDANATTIRDLSKKGIITEVVASDCLAAYRNGNKAAHSGSEGLTLSDANYILVALTKLIRSFSAKAGDGSREEADSTAAVPGAGIKGPRMSTAFVRDWKCPGCGDLQFARNITCRLCGASRPSASPAAATSASAEAGVKGDWKCPGCGDLQFARNTTCRMCGASRPSGSPAVEDAASSKGHGKGESGDWKCRSCGDLQFARNAKCRMCGAKRPGRGASRSPGPTRK